jgi:hypothetical protein
MHLSAPRVDANTMKVSLGYPNAGSLLRQLQSRRLSSAQECSLFAVHVRGVVREFPAVSRGPSPALLTPGACRSAAVHAHVTLG